MNLGLVACKLGFHGPLESVVEEVGHSKTAPMVKYKGVWYMYTKDILKCKRCKKVLGHHIDGTMYSVGRDKEAGVN